MTKLTKRYIDALPTTQRDLIYWDDDLTGFGLRVKPSGVRSFLIQYRNREQLTRRFTFGKYGALTPEQARKEARKLLGGVARGADPSAEKRAASRSMTVRELCDLYLKEAEAGRILNRSGSPKKSSTLDTDRGRIRRHIIPLLGARKVSALTRQIVQRFMFDVAAGKTAADVKTKARGRAIVEGGKGTASRTVGLLGGILTFAVREGVIDSNPARGVERYADQRRNRILSADEWQALGAELVTAVKKQTNPRAIAAFRLAALAGLRKNEILALKWSEVDRAGKAIRLSDSKTGASIRPLGVAALALLDGLSRKDDAVFVFPATRGNGHFVGLPRIASAIFEAAGIDGASLHTLRHSFASVANEMGYTEPTVAAMLGHSSGTITGRYIHHLDSALIEAADKVSLRIDAMMNGEQGKIIPLHTKARGAKNG